MKDVLEVAALILFTCFVAALFFIFKGDPDLWDLAHQSAMNYFKEAK